MPDKSTISTADEIIALLQKNHNGSYTLEGNEFDSLLKAMGDPKVVDEVNKKLGRTITADQFNDAAASLLKEAQNYPNYQARLERKMKRGELTGDVASGLNVAKDIFQLGVANSQVKQSNRALRQQQRPNLPALPQDDKNLSNAILDAQKGTFNAARTIEPARQAINRGYAQDLVNARSAAGGQGAQFSAMAQEAALQRNRSLGELAPVIDNARAREQARLDTLISKRSDQRQQDFGNRENLYNLQNANYNQNANAAAQLGLAGRENLYGAVNNLPDSLAVFAGNYGTRDYGQNNQYHPVPEFNSIQNVIQKYGKYRDPSYLRNPYYNPSEPQ